MPRIKGMNGLFRVDLFFLQFIYIKHLYTNSKFRFKAELNEWGVILVIGKGPYKRSHQLRMYLGISKEGLKQRRILRQIRTMKPLDINIFKKILEELESDA